ncbi:MAG: hypothetical protein JKY37_21625 [Nannocystaceae bacterium]|nr:hypothetical protein [Nannocystaceae bacterium]
MATGPIVVINWTPDALGLIETMVGSTAVGARCVVCVGTASQAQIDATLTDEPLWREVRYHQAPEINDGVDALATMLQSIDIADARSIVVLPQRDAAEPDANSRVVCVALTRACGEGKVPNTVVEVEDPEAAYEFAGLGVATVFYPGYLRAALLAQACVDLGVFQFVYGLLDGRYRVRLLPIPASLTSATFRDAALELEIDDKGNPITVIGLQKRTNAELMINPGPRTELSDALGLLVLEES